MIGIIIALASIGLTMVGVMVGMMFWVRTEANSLRTDAKEDRKDLLNLVRAIENEVKDFHYRLIEIERNRK
jgi:hypothetical protein